MIWSFRAGSSKQAVSVTVEGQQNRLGASLAGWPSPGPHRGPENAATGRLGALPGPLAGWQNPAERAKRAGWPELQG